MVEIIGILTGGIVSSPREELIKEVAESAEKTKRYFFTLKPSFIKKIDSYRKTCGKKYSSRSKLVQEAVEQFIK